MIHVTDRKLSKKHAIYSDTSNSENIKKFLHINSVRKRYIRKATNEFYMVFFTNATQLCSKFFHHTDRQR